jgi:TonB family protein
MVKATLKRFLWMILVSYCAGCATAYRPPSVAPPPLWDGRSGWEIDAGSRRVHEGVKQVGDALVEHDARLIRTGIVKEAIRMKNAYGTELIIPEGAKAFATNFTLITGPRQVRQIIDPIEWCVFLPQGINGRRAGAETVCIFWETEQQARYDQDYQIGGFAFLPSMVTPSGMPGAVPKIEEQPVDFGVQFKRQIRIGEMTESGITFETGFSDGTHFKRSSRNTYDWKNDGTFVYQLGDDTALLTPSPDRTTVDVKFQRSPKSSRTVTLDVLVGTDGGVVDARIAGSSGNEKLDQAALREVKRTWKLTPATENGQPVEKWGRFSVEFQLKE